MRTDSDQPSQNEREWKAQKWANHASPIEAAQRLETTISVRFDPDAAHLLRRAARLAGVTKSEFVRRSTIAAANKKITETPPAVVARSVILSPTAPVTGSGHSKTNPMRDPS